MADRPRGHDVETCGVAQRREFRQRALAATEQREHEKVGAQMRRAGRIADQTLDQKGAPFPSCDPACRIAAVAQDAYGFRIRPVVCTTCARM